MNIIKAFLYTTAIFFVLVVTYIWLTITDFKKLITLIELGIVTILSINYLIPKLGEVKSITLTDIVVLEIVTFIGFDLYNGFKNKLK